MPDGTECCLDHKIGGLLSRYSVRRFDIHRALIEAQPARRFENQSRGLIESQADAIGERKQ